MSDLPKVTTATNGDLAFTVRRLNVQVPNVRGFQRDYERAVPDIPSAQVEQLVRDRASWEEMLELIEGVAPHGFLIYYRGDVHPMMQLAGDAADCVAYLMGNHTTAERMFRHDPRAMLYAPLRTAIWEDAAGAAWFSFDQPSDQFSSFGIEAVAAVGVELDRKLAALLEALGVDVPASLDESRSGRGRI
jgi:uncharacterized protein (DUF302 family)